jgi:DNA-binding GntR family transcriptional regulator
MSVSNVATDPAAGARSGRGRLTELAYQHLREGILRGQIPAGSVLTEQELASELDISRTPVRHALGLLLKEGLVQVGPRRQLIVRGFTPEHRAEILEIREALERLAVEHACRVRSVEDVDYLRLLLMKQQRAANEGREDDFIDLDEQFHLRIAESAGLPILHGLLEQLRGFVRVLRLGSVRLPEHMQHVVAEHEAIVDALEDGDAARALDALRAHLHTSDYALAAQPAAVSEH